MDREGKDARFPVSANQQVPGALTRCVQAAMWAGPPFYLSMSHCTLVRFPASSRPVLDAAFSSTGGCGENEAISAV
jgi:hypothetical protein